MFPSGLWGLVSLLAELGRGPGVNSPKSLGLMWSGVSSSLSRTLSARKIIAGDVQVRLGIVVN